MARLSGFRKESALLPWLLGTHAERVVSGGKASKYLFLCSLIFDVNFVDKATFTSLHNWVLLKKIILAITESILLIMRSSQS